jgi:UDP-glucose 6-dehydrogenase
MIPNYKRKFVAVVFYLNFKWKVATTKTKQFETREEAEKWANEFLADKIGFIKEIRRKEITDIVD